MQCSAVQCSAVQCSAVQCSAVQGKVRYVVDSININGLYKNFDSLVSMIKGVIDILIITETKIDQSLPTQQFLIEGYASPLRVDRNIEGGGVLIYVREDLGVKRLHNTNDAEENNLEGIFFEVNLKKNRWLMFGGYDNRKANIDSFLTQVGSAFRPTHG